MLGLKNLAMLPSYFDYIFVHLKQKARLRPDLSPKFLSTSGPNPARNPARLTTLDCKEKFIAIRRVARIWKRGGGLLKKSEKSAKNLDSNFHCSWIKITRFVRKVGQNFSESSEIHRKWDWFYGQNRKFKRFFRPITGDLKKKKKVFTKIETDFSAKIGYSNAFSDRITTSTSQLRHPISFGRGCFQFFTKNRPQKHQKRAILHTSQANGGGSSPPPPPPPLATLLIAMVVFSVLDATFYSLIQSNVTSR